MESWKRNLYILWFGNFFASVGMGMIIPFLPLYVRELGVENVTQAALWSSWIFAVNHLMIAIVAPFWGRYSDRYGQKSTLVRTGFGLTVVIVAMGLAQSPLQLLLLRMLFGMMGGFGPAAVSLMAKEAPKEQVGRVLGTMQTGNISGQLMGPLLGGVMAEWVGMRSAFYCTGFFLLLATLLIRAGVRESRAYPTHRLWSRPELRRLRGRRGFGWLWRFRGLRPLPRSLRGTEPLSGSAETAAASGGGNGGGRASTAPAGCAADDAAKQAGAATAGQTSFRDIVGPFPVMLFFFASSFLISGSFQSISPIITLYVQSMHIENHVELISGLIFAATALGTVIAAPIMGRLGDRYGHLLVLLCCLTCVGLLHIPQAITTNAWVLMGIRFVFGLCVGGLIPSLNSLLRRVTPTSIQGSVFAYDASCHSAGNVTGAVLGGLVASQFGFASLFCIIAGVFLVHSTVLALQYRRITRACAARESAL